MVSHLWCPFSLCPSVSGAAAFFFLLFSSCGAGLGSRESHPHKDVLLLGLNAAEGVEALGWVFPCQ